MYQCHANRQLVVFDRMNKKPPPKIYRIEFSNYANFRQILLETNEKMELTNFTRKCYVQEQDHVTRSVLPVLGCMCLCRGSALCKPAQNIPRSSGCFVQAYMMHYPLQRPFRVCKFSSINQSVTRVTVVLFPRLLNMQMLHLVYISLQKKNGKFGVPFIYQFPTESY